MKVDLLHEATIAAGRVREPELRRMEALGVPQWALAHIGERQPPFGLQAIEETSDGLFEPVEDGPLAIVMPVVETVSVDWRGYETDVVEIIDLIAFYSRNPLRWWWRTGDGWALGLDLLDHDAPMPLVAHPLAWLAEGGAAFCLLDWSLPPQRWARLRDGPPAITEDDILRRRLNAAYAAHVPPLVAEPSKWTFRNGRYVSAA